MIFKRKVKLGKFEKTFFAWLPITMYSFNSSDEYVSETRWLQYVKMEVYGYWSQSRFGESSYKIEYKKFIK